VAFLQNKKWNLIIHKKPASRTELKKNYKANKTEILPAVLITE
jgi:hypothetical protein